MRTIAPSSRPPLTTLATVLALLAVDAAHAAEPQDVCKRAREQLGARQIERGMKPEDCQQALDAAEEERWQLWLDIAAADQLVGDSERAALSLNRFLVAADARPRPLSAQWVVARDQARADLARMDGELLQKKARVSITSTPEGADVTILGGGAVLLEKTPKTPLIAYFEPGSHTARLFLSATDATREITFTVRAGTALELVVDLRTGALAQTAVRERPGPRVLGQLPGLAGGDPTQPPIVAEPEPVEPEVSVVEPTVVIEDKTPDPDDEGPPIKPPGTPLGETLGTIGIAAGGAAIAIGTTFALVAAGLDDEAACKGTACEIDKALRARVRRDADVAWDRATGTLIVGTLLVAGGVAALFLLDDEGGSDTGTDVTLTPWLAPDGAGLGGHVRF